jgi:ATP-binding cassette, subfamily B, bacterial
VSAARIVWPYVAPRWRALAGSGAATVVLTAAEMAKPWPLALVVDRLLEGTEPPFALTAGDWWLLTAVAALVLGIAVAEGVARYLSDLWLQTAGERITHELRVAAYDHLQRLSLRYHEHRPKGDLVARVTGDVDAMGTLFSQSLGEVVQSGLLALGMAAVALWIDPVLGLVSVATMPLMAAVAHLHRRRLKEHARRRRAQDGRIASLAGEALSAMTVVKAFGSGGFESQRVRDRSEARMAAGVEVARVQARFDGLVGVVRAVGTALVLVIGVVRVAAGAIGPGELIVLVSYTRKGHSPMRSLAREATKIAVAMARVERVAELLAADDVLEERPAARAGGRANGEVALEGVSFAYQPERPALRDVTLRVAAGERVAVMGPSGAGKSTLGALVARLHDPAAGRVLIDGRDAREYALAWLRDQVGIVLQDTALFTGTVRENIAYGTSATDEQVERAARAAAAHDFIRALPQGYDTELGPQGVGLSGGQRQRIGIARTLLRDPPILLLDEPTTGLDEDGEGELLAGLGALMRDRTTILITHSRRLARLADRVVELHAGRIARARPPRLLDPALPQLERLLDVDAMQAVLGRDADVGDVNLQRVVYKPHKLAAVHYRMAVEGRPHDAVATVVTGVDLAAQARKPRYVALARRASERAPAPEPLRFDADVGALVSWLPFDPRLPALASPEVGGFGEPVLIGYKPRARAVLRAGDHVLKAYGSAAVFEAAVTGLVTAARHSPLPTADFAGADPELRLIAQGSVRGELPGSAAEVAERAGALVAALQRASLPDLPSAPPASQLEAAAHKAALIAAVLPALWPRLQALMRRLRATLPRPTELVPAHGDFHVDQLLLSGDEIAVVDFDQLCLAAPAVDLATYAADVVRGREGDLEALAAVLEPLLAGFCGRPDALDWHLTAAILERAAHPFQRQVPEWPGRTEAMLALAEASR